VRRYRSFRIVDFVVVFIVVAFFDGAARGGIEVGPR